MASRTPSLDNRADIGIAREIGSKYDDILAVKNKLTEIELVAGFDIDALIAELEAAQDFTGITVITGEVTSWNPISKVLTVATVKGDKGDQGEVGPVGPQGNSITGPQGPKGDVGPIGPQGVRGLRGYQGETGPKGDTGLTGPQGIQGLTGPQGPAGLTGPQGEQGPAGADGTVEFSELTPEQVASLKGPKGDTGAQGIQGPIGPIGLTGPRGFTGDTGPVGPTGLTGPQGPQGLQGLTGPKGDTGATGAQGIQGIQGIKGDKGDIGLQGAQGIQGLQGIKGDTGDAVDHASRTVGTGAAGTTDTYTLWGDVGETVNMGTFDVYNGANGTGTMQSVVAGTNISIDNTDPNNPVISATASSTVAELDDLDDVVLTTNVAGDVLRYNGTEWVNSSGLTDAETAISNVYTKTESDTNYEPKNTNIQTHISSTNNPHSVTKTQVGLGNVDNTSDVNKPISTATQTAIDAKQDTLVSGTNIKTINSSSILGSGNLALLPSTNPSITGSITEQVYNLTGTAINPANGTIQYKTVSANTTFTETLTAGQSVVLRLINASSYTITFPTITWVGKVAPTLTANCAIVIWKEQTTLYGAYVGTLV